MSKFHTPVLVAEVMEALHVQPGKKYIDCTVGGGGHAQAIIEKGGIILGIDRDPEAITEAETRLKSACFVSQNQANKALRNSAFPPFQLIQGNFENLKDFAQSREFSPVSGILFDLGASTHQLLSSTRGFSFQSFSPLDMRMNPELNVTAKDLVNALGPKELYDLFTRLAQEKRARTIAARIVSARRQKPLETTRELAQLVEEVYRGKRGRLHPATKVFQALRIAVNDELYSLQQALPQALELLEPGGRLVIISFHEGEDRIVKHYVTEQVGAGHLITVVKKPITPQPEEIAHNPNARSAKLRAVEKIAVN